MKTVYTMRIHGVRPAASGSVLGRRPRGALPRIAAANSEQNMSLCILECTGQCQKAKSLASDVI